MYIQINNDTCLFIVHLWPCHIWLSQKNLKYKTQKLKEQYEKWNLGINIEKSLSTM